MGKAIIGALVFALAALIFRVEHAERAADPHAARYDAALQRAIALEPRFDATYVQIRASALGRLAREYPVIDTGVRVSRVDVPAHRAGYEAFVRGVGDGRVHNGELSVVALLVRQTTPGEATRIGLRVRRLKLRSFAELLDPTDLVRYQGKRSVAEELADERSGATVWWTGRKALVPLAVLDRRVTDDPNLIAANGGIGVWSLARGTVLVPRSLRVEHAGRTARVSIEAALGNPLALTDG